MLVTVISVIILACATAWFAIPAIINVAGLKQLFDDPAQEERKIHTQQTPNLGGIAIFSSFLISSGLFLNYELMSYANYLLASGVIIFTIGLKDDLVGLDPYKKFAAQLLAAFIITYMADIRLTSFYGFLGIYDIDPVLSYAVSGLLFIFIVNSFNLIDGIDGLVASIGLVVAATYGVIFYLMDQQGFAVISFALVGALIGFLRFNISPAKIFMGDAGSYTLGFLVAVLTLKFIELNKFDAVTNPAPYIKSAPAVALAILVVPVFDTIRVFFIRLVKGRSPFSADRNHLHHRLIDDLRLSHTRASFILATVNVLFILMAFNLQRIGTMELLITVFLVAQMINVVLWLYDVRSGRQSDRTIPPLPDGKKKSDPKSRDEERKAVEELLKNIKEN